jgi:hypothetical protein
MKKQQPQVPVTTANDREVTNEVTTTSNNNMPQVPVTTANDRELTNEVTTNHNK